MSVSICVGSMTMEEREATAAFLVEEVVVHVVVVGLSVVPLDRVVLIEVESHHVLEAQFPRAVQPDQLLVHPDRSAAGRQPEHEGLSSAVLLDDRVLDDLGHGH